MNWIVAYFENFVSMFVDMAFYIMLGLFFVGILHTYINKDQVLKHLGQDKFSSVIKASLVGVPLPLCSCGVVPTAVELKKDGASNGAVISFLISTPQTGVDSIFATYSMMGLFMAIFRPIAAFVSGIVGGGIINLFAKHDTIHEDIAIDSCHCGCASDSHAHSSCGCSHTEHESHSSCGCHPEPVAHCSCGCGHSHSSSDEAKWKQVFSYAYGEFLEEIAGHFLLGMVLAAAIATFLPADFFVSLGLHSGIVAMLAMVLIGLPMYICSTSSIPIAISLIGKGLSMGGGFVFLFTGPVTNIASLLVLAKVLGKKITGMYIGVVVCCSIAFGLLLDFILEQSAYAALFADMHSMGHGVIPDGIMYIVALIFAVLLVRWLVGIAKIKFAK